MMPLEWAHESMPSGDGPDLIPAEEPIFGPELERTMIEIMLHGAGDLMKLAKEQNVDYFDLADWFRSRRTQYVLLAMRELSDMSGQLWLSQTRPAEIGKLIKSVNANSSATAIRALSDTLRRDIVPMPDGADAEALRRRQRERDLPDMRDMQLHELGYFHKHGNPKPSPNEATCEKDSPSAGPKAGGA